MLEETGQVVRLAPEGVWVETVRQSACGSCSARKGCGQRLLAEVGQGQRFEVLAENPHNFSLCSGDQVVLGLAESSFLKASAMVYLVPLLVMVLLSAIAQVAGFAEPLVVVAGLLGLGGGFMLARLMSRQAESGCQFQPAILRVQT